MARWGTAGRAHKRATIVGASLVTAAIIGLVVALPLLNASDTTPSVSALEQDAVPVEVQVEVSEGGISVGMKTTFAEDLTLSSPTMQSDQKPDVTTMSPMGVDHQSEGPEPLVLPKGTPVLITSYLLPKCKSSPSAEDVVFTVRARSKDGTEEVRRFTSRRPGMLGEATQKWCSKGPSVRSVGGGLSPDGDAQVDLKVSNPGPDTIHVEVPAFSQGGATWHALSATVPAGEDVHLIVKGSGVRYDGTQELPWEKGRLLIDGEPFKLPTPDDGWLG